MSETATYEYRSWTPAGTFRWVKIASFTELAVFAGLLIVWAIPGLEGPTFGFGMSHGIGYLTLCALIFVAILGYVAFGQTSDLWTWVGAVIIFGATWYITWRETRKKRS